MPMSQLVSYSYGKEIQEFPIMDKILEEHSNMGIIYFLLIFIGEYNIKNLQQCFYNLY
jgi:hypothetical protein